MSQKKKTTTGKNFHRIEPAVVDVYGTPIVGRSLHELNHQRVTIVGNQVTIRKQYTVHHIRNRRIFCDRNVKVMTRENGHYMLTAEIDPKEVRKCLRTRRTITMAIDAALEDFSNHQSLIINHQSQE